MNKYLLKIFMLILSCIVGVSAYSQINQREPDIGGGGFGNPPLGGGDASKFGTKGSSVSREEYRRLQDSLKENSIKPSVKFWRLKSDGAFKSRYENTDTLGMDIHVLNPFYRQSIAQSFVGNTGGAHKSMIYVNRNEESDFPFLTPYSSYLSLPHTHLFMDTHTPYTEIKYVTGKQRGAEETILDVLFSRNVKKGWNVGVEYSLITSYGQYPEQKQRDYHFTLFSSYEIGRYNLYGFLSHNRLKEQENGGLKNDLSVEIDTTVNASDMEVRLVGARTNFHNYNYYLSHHFNIGVKRMRLIDADSVAVYPIKLAHTIDYEKSFRLYSDKDGKDGREFFYSQAFYENTGTSGEEYTQERLKNTIHLILNEKYFKWFRYGVFAQLSHERHKYGMLDLDGKFPFGFLLKHKDITRNDIAFKGGAFYHSSDRIKWDADWKMYLLGDRVADTEAQFHYTHNFGTDSIPQHRFRLKFQMESKMPHVFMERFFSNRIRWENNFEKQTLMEFGGSYAYKKWGLELGGYYTMLNNYIYYGYNVVPEQYSDPINLATVFLRTRLRLWRFYFSPTVYLQRSSNENVLPVPRLSAYANTYFEGDLYNKAVRVRLGVDGRYFSKWYAPSYFPAIGQFHLQSQKKIGNFPKMDVYLTMRFKRASFFIKYEHINVLFGNTAYFSALHYPFNPNILKYGIRWHFYD